MTHRLLRFFQVPDQDENVSKALLLMRLVAGVAFLHHGWFKVQNPFGWMGPDSSIPGFLQGLAALAEFGGGLAWILGLLTSLATLGIICTMLGAIFTHAVVNGDPFVNMMGGPAYEMASLFLVIAFVILAAGPGRYSLDRAIFGRRPGIG